MAAAQPLHRQDQHPSTVQKKYYKADFVKNYHTLGTLNVHIKFGYFLLPDIF
jgi:hypothetical protein